MRNLLRASDPIDKSVKATLPANSDDLERLARNLPRGTLEGYSTTILPMLLNHCSTAGCHSVGTQSKFVLLRPTPGSATARRLTLRDLHNTLDWIDYDTPASSKLLTSARQAHGTCTAPAIEKEESREYQQLVSWIILATQGEKNAGRHSGERDRATDSEDRCSSGTQTDGSCRECERCCAASECRSFAGGRGLGQYACAAC